MRSDITEILIPSIAFFVAFFMAFSLLDAIILLILNRLIFHYWGFTIETFLLSKTLYGQSIQIFTVATIALMIGALLKFTAFIPILISATPEVKIFAAELLLEIVLIYLFSTRKLTQFAVEKQIHRTLFIYMSLVFYVFLVILTNPMYERYKTFINANVAAAFGNAERVLESRQKNALLKEFRHQIYRGGCSPANFTQTNASFGVKHFLYVTTDRDLRQARNSGDEDGVDPFIGRVCTNGQETFLLTDYGKWYWVIDDA